MGISCAQVQSAVSSQIDTLSGFRQVRMLPSFFGRSQNTIAHLGYSVEIFSSSALAERQRRTVGVVLTSLVRVTFAYRLRPSDIITDYKNALDKEQEIIGAVIQSYNSIQSGLEIRFDRATRRAPESQEYLISDIEFEALHTITF